MCKKTISRFLVLAFSLGLTSSTAGAQATASKPLKIGSIAGLTGEYAQAFQNWTDGITLAAEEYNAAHPERHVEIIAEDDGFSSTKGLSAYRKLTDVDHINALLNGTSPTIGAIAPIVKKTAMPVIQLGEEVDEPSDDNIFQVMPGNIALERALGRALAEETPKDLVLFYTANPTMIRFVRAFEDGYKLPLTKYELDPSVSDFKTQVTLALSKRPARILIMAFPPQGASLVREVQRQAATPPPFAFDANFQSGLAEYERLVGDLSFLRPAILARISKQSDPSFIARYQKRYGKPPGIAADLGYDAFAVLSQSYHADGAEWISALKKTELDGVSGHIAFDENGIRRPDVVISTVASLLDESKKS